MIKVAIADDHPVVRAGLRGLLAVEPDIEIVAEASSATEAIEIASRFEPDLVLMDLQFGSNELQGAAATRKIRALRMPPRVLILTNYDSDVDILSAIEAGACGYLLKDAPPDQLLEAIRTAAAGESSIGPALAQRRDSRMAALSSRELEIVELLAAGKSNREICDQLFLSGATVKSHLNHIYSKLEVKSRTGALARARELGLVRS